MADTGERQRLDMVLVSRGFAPTRARARDQILRGCVVVDGRPAAKPGLTVSQGAEIRVSDPLAGYVSRAAMKLIAGLDQFALSPEGRLCLDIGASTGGFTQVLLERGARHVTAIDVGHGQLAAEIAADPRVTSREGLNARALTAADLAAPPEMLVSDVSFISLTLALPPALALAAPGALGLFLVKPQFEVGRALIGKGGLVRDAEAGADAARRIADWLDGRAGWQVIGLAPCPLPGEDGNREFLLAARKAETTPAPDTAG